MMARKTQMFQGTQQTTRSHSPKNCNVQVLFSALRTSGFSWGINC